MAHQKNSLGNSRAVACIALGNKITILNDITERPGPVQLAETTFKDTIVTSGVFREYLSGPGHFTVHSV